MKLVADLHIHSHFSRATSKDLTFEHLARWAQRKGVHVVGTGDIAHPGWLQEMRDPLMPVEECFDDLTPHIFARTRPRAWNSPWSYRWLRRGSLALRAAG